MSKNVQPRAAQRAAGCKGHVARRELLPDHFDWHRCLLVGLMLVGLMPMNMLVGLMPMKFVQQGTLVRVR